VKIERNICRLTILGKLDFNAKFFTQMHIGPENIYYSGEKYYSVTLVALTANQLWFALDGAR